MRKSWYDKWERAAQFSATAAQAEVRKTFKSQTRRKTEFA